MEIKLTSNGIGPDLQKKMRELEKLPQEALTVFKDNTPIREGNARRRTKLENRATINADYPYATRLDNGYSKQRPRGMSEPTLKFVKDKLDKTFGK
jgi:hypothetical protein